MSDLYELVHPSISDQRRKWRAKMSFADRCAALALIEFGYPASVIAELYEIHSRTASQIARDSSPHYKAVRTERSKLGLEGFRRTYLTPDKLREANDIINKRRVVVKENAPAPAPVKRSAGVGGKHMLFGHSVEVLWLDDKAGWFYHADGDGQYIGPFNNSKAALDQAKIDMELMI